MRRWPGRNDSHSVHEYGLVKKFIGGSVIYFPHNTIYKVNEVTLQ